MLNNAAYEEDWYLGRPHLMKAELDSPKLCELAVEVGGDDVLEALDDSPLPDEPSQNRRPQRHGRGFARCWKWSTVAVTTFSVSNTVGRAAGCWPARQ